MYNKYSYWVIDTWCGDHVDYKRQITKITHRLSSNHNDNKKWNLSVLHFEKKNKLSKYCTFLIGTKEHFEN